MNVAERLLQEIELARVGNPGRPIAQIQMSPMLYAELLKQLGTSSAEQTGDVLTVFGIPVVVLRHQHGEFMQLVWGLTH